MGLRTLRRSLGLRLATYRHAAGVSQPELAHALGRTRTTISKVEHGTRGMPEEQWKITDEVCRAEGALVSEHATLAQAEQDYRWSVAHPAASGAASGGAGRRGCPPGLAPTRGGAWPGGWARCMAADERCGQ
ncbi:MAG: helix-turn-helix domain-containing protein [Pseudonocardiaceae bacterium]